MGPGRAPGVGAGRACEAGDKVATKSESWTAAEEVARESLHGQKLREQDGDEGVPPTPPTGWLRKPAGSRLAWETGRHHPKSRGPPFPQGEFLITLLYQSWRKDKALLSHPTTPTQPQGEGRRERGEAGGGGGGVYWVFLSSGG